MSQIQTGSEQCPLSPFAVVSRPPSAAKRSLPVWHLGATSPVVAGAAPERQDPVKYGAFGGRIDLILRSPTKFLKDTPFHVRHGHALRPGVDRLVGLFDFELGIDGVLQVEDYATRTFDPSVEYLLSLWWTHNFPDGLPEGSYTFTGHWFGPCQWAVDEIATFSEPCPSRNSQVEFWSESLTDAFHKRNPTPMVT